MGVVASAATRLDAREAGVELVWARLGGDTLGGVGPLGVPMPDESSVVVAASERSDGVPKMLRRCWAKSVDGADEAYSALEDGSLTVPW